jgi:hypothetical protein
MQSCHGKANFRTWTVVVSDGLPIGALVKVHLEPLQELDVVQRLALDQLVNLGNAACSGRYTLATAALQSK